MSEVEVDRETATAMVECLEDAVMEVIALEDEITFSFRTISGYEKEPWRITGYYSTLAKPEKRRGWSVAKGGTPQIKWSKSAKYYQPIDPTEYFDRPENRYTTKARQYRKDLGIPELSEYDDMTEEEIVAFCKKADAEKRGPLTPRQQGFINRHDKERRRIMAAKEQLLIEEDLQRQRDEGVPEEELVRHTKEEIDEILKDKWRSIQNREKWTVKRDSHY